MTRSPRRRTIITIAGALLTLQGSFAAQTPALAKRPLTYDVVDYWKSIQGTRLSEDGQWLPHATAAPGHDGDVFVRHLTRGYELNHPPRTSPPPPPPPPCH